MLKFLYFLCLIQVSLIFAEGKILIGIAGGTGSGKTTLARKILDAFPNNAIIIPQDAYYKDLSSLSPDQREEINFDHPDSIDFNLLKENLLCLKQGLDIQKPVYNFCSHTRELRSEHIDSHPIIIVEGILLFAVPEILNILDIKIFVDASPDVRILRRIERDIIERGRSFESICKQYLSTVKPMHDLFVEPSKKNADLIVPDGGENQPAVDMIVARLKGYLEQAKDPKAS